MIMRELVEVSAQIGDMKSDNPIMNLIYKIIKRKKLKEIYKKIGAFPIIPSDEDIKEFSSIYPIASGMDIDGDAKWFGELCSIVWSRTGLVFTIWPLDEDNPYISYTVIVDGSITYSGTRMNTVTRDTKIDPKYAKKYLGIIIKMGMRSICSKLILGGR